MPSFLHHLIFFEQAIEAWVDHDAIVDTMTKELVTAAHVSFQWAKVHRLPS